MMNSVHFLLNQASKKLVEAIGLAHVEASLEVNLLLQHLLKVNRAWLISHDRDVLTDDQQQDFYAVLQRRLSGEPIAYILGFREFYGLPLKVTPATLIPRPDTETLVEAAFQKISVDVAWDILDLGTGTGAVALAIAKHRPTCNLIGLDASVEALALAIENAQHLDLKNVRFIKSNWFSDLAAERFNLIVSNPPYIAEGDCHLTQGDLRFEPRSALVSGVDGLDDIRRIIQDAPNYLKPNGWLMLEHGYDQAHSVASLLKGHGFSQIDHAQDLAGTLRVTFGSIA
jgi:release factor glutamine methyltransferase